MLTELLRNILVFCLILENISAETNSTNISGSKQQKLGQVKLADTQANNPEKMTKQERQIEFIKAVVRRLDQSKDSLLFSCDENEFYNPTSNTCENCFEYCKNVKPKFCQVYCPMQYAKNYITSSQTPMLVVNFVVIGILFILVVVLFVKLYLLNKKIFSTNKASYSNYDEKDFTPESRESLVKQILEEPAKDVEARAPHQETQKRGKHPSAPILAIQDSRCDGQDSPFNFAIHQPI